MSALILDIETAGFPANKFDKATTKLIQQKLLKELADDPDKNAEEFFGLSPYTGQIVAIGTVDSESKRGAVYYLDPTGNTDDKEQEGVVFRSFITEAELLAKFWDLADKYDTFVTFNGRTFDLPFLNIRSAINKIKPSKDLMQGRYLYQQRGVTHIDVYDQLTYYGGFRFTTGGSLHMACQAFGISTPKEGDVDGSKVTPMFEAGRYREIAEYNARDIRATKELYSFWRNYLAL
ncbi:MAG: ribonuclease H-like domain-containing protein [Patescibacteria group bacterium]